MNTNSFSLVRKLRAFSFAILLVPLLQQGVAAHSFSTSFLTLEPSTENPSTQLRWSWRFTAHDIEALTGSPEPAAALPLLAEWLQFGDDCRLQPSDVITSKVHAGEQTYTYSGTAPCAYADELTYRVRHIFGPLPDHKVLRQ